MLPACRTAGDEFAIPTFDLTPRDVAGFTDELQEFQSLFHDCFPRSEPRAHFFDYMVGQLSPLARKSIEPMALRVPGGSVRGLQRFLSEVPWDEEHMRWTYHQLVAEEMGEPDGVLMFDETGFVKKGTDSVGVARQYCGPLGKVENCQVGVFAGYASRKGYALVDKRLFLPEAWFTDAYAGRRTKCQVPPELTWQSKPQLAAAMLEAMTHEGLLPFKYIVADCLYGNSPTFLDAVDACVGRTALVAVPSETRCWLQCPQIEAKSNTYKGEARVKRVVVAPDSAPSTVATVAASLPASRWHCRKVSEGTKGPIAYAFARQRVTLCKEGLPDRTVWLVIKRTLGAEPSYAFAISNAPASTPLSTLVWLSGLRWAVEQCFEEGKTELGMAHLRSAQIYGVAPPYADDHAGAFFSVALDDPRGEKKPRRSRCHKCGSSWKWSYPGRRIGLRTSSRYLPGDSGAITAPICRIESGGRPRAKTSSVVGLTLQR
jgi:SRSO17 transposase